MLNQFKFEPDPLEKARGDYKALNHFQLVGKNLNDLELKMHNRDTELFLAAQNTVHLRNKYNELKGKDEAAIIKEANKNLEAADAADTTEEKVTPFIDSERKSTLYFRVIKSRSEVYDIITRSFSRKSRWNELPHGLDLRNSWNLLWTWSKIKSDVSKLLCWQRANHFIGAKNVSRKDFLKRNIERA